MDTSHIETRSGEPHWPDEDATARAGFYGIRTASLLANEARWIHRRVERFELLDERRAVRHTSVDFTLPDLPAAPWEFDGRRWLIPVALLERRLLRALDVRDERGAALPVLTREQNSGIAWSLLSSLASETLEEVLAPDTELDGDLLRDLADVAGARRAPDDQPSAAEREARAGVAIQLFREAAIRAARSPQLVSDARENQRQLLWRDSAMRGFMTTLATRFLLLVAIDGNPGDRRIIKISFEEELGTPAIISFDIRKTDVRDVWRQLRTREVMRALASRMKSSLGLSAYSIKAPTRAVFGPESYHVEIDAPDELMIEHASLERLSILTNLETGRIEYQRTWVAEDFSTERAHLYESLFTGGDTETSLPPEANEEVLVGSTITADLFIRPSFLRPPLVIGLVTTAMLLTGLTLDSFQVSRIGDVTALIVVLPALFAAYLIPGEHRLVRLMFRGLRSLVLLLAVVSFVAAGTLTLALSHRVTLTIWAVLAVLSAGSTLMIWSAYLIAKGKMGR